MSIQLVGKVVIVKKIMWWHQNRKRLNWLKQFMDQVSTASFEAFWYEVFLSWGFPAPLICNRDTPVSQVLYIVGCWCNFLILFYMSIKKSGRNSKGSSWL
ncbi:hypothetical protein HanRHA438_Chr04g0188081 [Helianthus annuus]|uniref:Uncharacterized protein n=1 Tax=Helianthus annuus TaxID=4232 RepID=A0A251V4N0_HELAN|nr:hypothetical protein HanXRQr2_Chr04g0178521 [Helianthus annuus]KAJ0581869.1 hypothetical protein HanHA300_Chr04g0146021 [Helianthus annuus]KAJ0589960.1 hypothetical protein HanIR_Chr04g0192121 [Helianthus annuus]KAJ0927898.1 hypothetical protein HanRHA438_Chr04g0188081 [Helianthus annuus]